MKVTKFASDWETKTSEAIYKLVWSGLKISKKKSYVWYLMRGDYIEAFKIWELQYKEKPISMGYYQIKGFFNFLRTYDERIYQII